MIAVGSICAGQFLRSTIVEYRNSDDSIMKQCQFSVTQGSLQIHEDF